MDLGLTTPKARSRREAHHLIQIAKNLSILLHDVCISTLTETLVCTLPCQGFESYLAMTTAMVQALTKFL